MVKPPAMIETTIVPIVKHESDNTSGLSRLPQLSLKRMSLFYY